MVADTVAALIPALNEEKSVGKVVQGVLHYVSDVYVIDDHSMDSTRRAAKNAGAVVISNEYERGIERATLFGIRSMDFSNIIILDADGQHAPKFIPSLLEPLKKNSGNRLAF